MLGRGFIVAVLSTVVTCASAALPAVAWPQSGHANDHAAHEHNESDRRAAPRAEAEMTRQTMEATAGDAKAAADASSGDVAVEGQWGPVIPWDVVGIHTALLTNGKILAWDSVGDQATEKYSEHSKTRAVVWDPASGVQTPVWVSGFNLFCAGFAHLGDGTLFVSGGNKNADLDGIIQTHYFDEKAHNWSRGPDMRVERWYPSVTPLPNGEQLITGGGPTLHEVYDHSTKSLRALTSAYLDLPLYPWIDTAPDGRAFYSGPSTTMRSLDTNGTGAWQSFGQRDSINRDYGARAVYDVGKILVAGGAGSVRDARVVDFNGASPTSTATSPMAFGRRQHNLTVLADGSVLATGGLSSGASRVDLRAGVYNAELWNPATGAWRTLAPMRVTRQYHSSALLLRDGRILASGGGVCGVCDTVGYLGKNAEVFTPPYLFKQDGSGQLAPRPTISSAPATSGYGNRFSVGTPNAAAIRKVALVRLGSNTHSTEFEQRYVPLSFTTGTGSLSVAAPANANIAPPGPYMLFLIDANGVPSVSSVVSLQHVPPATSLSAPADGATYTAPATVALAAGATDPDGWVTKVEFFQGTTKLGEDTTAPYAFTWTGVPAGTYSVTSRATDNGGATATSAPRTIKVNPAPNAAPSVRITAPADGSTYRRGSRITISASASDSDGRVTKVEFFDGTTKIGEDTTASYSIRWRSSTSGTHALTARATDDAGAVTTSTTVRVTLQ